MPDYHLTFIKELAKTENFIVVSELVKLFPQINYERNSTLFKSAFESAERWDDFEVLDVPTDHLEITHKACLGRNIFRFSIFVGNNDKNWYYGVRGPWGRAIDVPEINDFKELCTTQKLTGWSDWMFKYFNTQRSVVLDSLNNNSDVHSLMVTLVNEFLEVGGPLKSHIDKVNSLL